MNKKPQKSWGEIQLAIAAIALTATLAFWNLFSVPQKQQELAQAQATAVPPASPNPTETPAPAATQGVAFVPIKIIFGGAMAQQPATQGAVVVAAQPAPKPKHKGGGGGGGKPPVTTGSSHP